MRAFDFSEELEQLDKVEKLRRLELESLVPNTPHQFCPCGRSLNDHLRDDIQACLDLRELFVAGNPEPLIAHATDEYYLLFALNNLYRELDAGDREYQVEILLRKIQLFAGSRLRMFLPYSEDVPQSPQTQREEDLRQPPFGRPPWHDGKLN